MSSESSFSRRRFLRSTSALTGASLLRISAPSLIAITEAACTAKQESSPFAVLNAADATDFAAIAARIMPTTDTPGANEAGVIYFIDRALGAEFENRLEMLRTGLANLNSRVSATESDIRRFAELDADGQDELLTGIEGNDFFDNLWLLTMMGFFAMSSYGGNKDNIAWDLIGFEGDHGAWEYPFGYYDAEYAREKADG
jgi:gluconate 2-dehydrogenase gamma chain